MSPAAASVPVFVRAHSLFAAVAPSVMPPNDWIVPAFVIRFAAVMEPDALLLRARVTIPPAWLVKSSATEIVEPATPSMVPALLTVWALIESWLPRIVAPALLVRLRFEPPPAPWSASVPPAWMSELFWIDDERRVRSCAATRLPALAKG